MPTRSTQRAKGENAAAHSDAESLEFKVAPKAAQALRLRRLGYTYARIAEEMGYKSESTARRIVKVASEKIVRAEACELIAVQLDHIDEALQVVLKRITADTSESLWAVDRLVPLLKRQAELMGLDMKADGSSINVPQGKRIIIEDAASVPLPPALAASADADGDGESDQESDE